MVLNAASPTADTSAPLPICGSAMQISQPDNNVYSRGGIIRTNPEKPRISLVFTSHDRNDGEESILALLDRHGIKGAFFFTGAFYELFPETIARLRQAGHYVGSHSYGHLLYMPWENPDSMLVSQQEFVDDMQHSYRLMREAGIEPGEAPVYIPPYEYYNEQISDWSRQLGLQVVNYTPGSWTNADYTIPSMGGKYRSSEFILNQVLGYEQEQGMNGQILLIHFGTHPERTDKFYDNGLEPMILELKARGYEFVPLIQALGLEYVKSESHSLSQKSRVKSQESKVKGTGWGGLNKRSEI